MQKSEITILSTPNGFTEQEVSSVGSIELYLALGTIAVLAAVAVFLWSPWKRKPTEPAEPTDRMPLYK